MTTLKQRSHNRTPLAMMYIGAGLTAIAALFAFIDQSTTTVLADHIKASYPGYEPGAIGAAIAAYLAILSTHGSDIGAAVACTRREGGAARAPAR
ncbi:hypothetical protein [Nonomuraea sp. B19D2]|uniref:hypothetical protein n=1 Tax=Nonomuraea sp. B19D2 TaxID=3159561 RepID=UPI0032DB0316